MRWLKLACLMLYAAALAGAAGMWRGEAAATVQVIALVLLAAHALEAVVAFRLVRRYPGPLVVSICLTLLFGLLHLKPLARQAGREKTTGS